VTVETDVLVGGTGPAGASAALFLATYCTRVLVVTKYGRLSQEPRAHITNQRAMETLRDMDAILRTTKGIKAAAEAELNRRKTPTLEKGDSTLTESHPADADSPALNRAGRRRLLKSVAKRR